MGALVVIPEVKLQLQFCSCTVPQICLDRLQSWTSKPFVSTVCRRTVRLPT